MAAWLTALWPLLIEFTTINVASELLFLALVLTALNIWISAGLSLTLRMILWGAAVAAATYVRPTALPVAFALPVIQWALDRNWRTLVKGLLISAITAALLFAPWTYRSLVQFDRFVLVSANGGVNLWMGNNPNSDGGYMDLPGGSFPPKWIVTIFYGAEAVKFILAHPSRYAALSIQRAVKSFDRNDRARLESESPAAKYQDITIAAMKRLSSAYWWALLLAGTAGGSSCAAAARYQQCWPLLAALAYFAAFPIFTVAMDRYHVPIDPLLAIFAAFAFCSIRYRPGAGGTSG